MRSHKNAFSHGGDITLQSTAKINFSNICCVIRREFPTCYFSGETLLTLFFVDGMFVLQTGLANLRIFFIVFIGLITAKAISKTEMEFWGED